ncbi:unnamed protein product [Paramecium sonneborni]|uniref:non-specific serine/threonine protein kinase n=1 Tax=Paramecium sonneborni TaxID=65129 RepID=A0A8S1RJC0_9CILI|nr:unnamed protein product [Paramecium sonneborni]
MDSRIINQDKSSLITNDCQVNEAQIKQYKKAKLLRVGAYNKTYLVTSDDQDEIKYVMKVVPQTISANTEAQILQNLRHDNIIQYIETFIDKKDRQIKTQPLLEAQIIDWFTQLCLAYNVYILKRQFIEILNQKIFSFMMIKLNQEILELLDLSNKILQLHLQTVVLYEMCTFKYPFIADSLPALANIIMKAKIQPISAQLYSQNMKNLIQYFCKQIQIRDQIFNKYYKMPQFKIELNNQILNNNHYQNSCLTYKETITLSCYEQIFEIETTFEKTLTQDTENLEKQIIENQKYIPLVTQFAQKPIIKLSFERTEK